MKYRKLRIAWSVGWGILAILLCVLWMRSYWWFHSISVPQPARVIVQSLLGTVTVIKYPVPKPSEYVLKGSWKVFPVQDLVPPYSSLPPIPHWSVQIDRKQLAVVFPYWFAIVVTSVIAGLSWLSLKFSLRTLLLATTLVAVVLGSLAWASRR